MKQCLLLHEASSSRSKCHWLVDCESGTHTRSTNMKMVARAATVAFALQAATSSTAIAQGTLAWDKTFPRSTRVDHQKVSFYNRLGITLVADLYVPKNLDRSRRHPAIVVGHPYGGVKEQTSGLYAQTMAER